MKIETPILRRLGPVPFWRGEQKCLDALERIYRKAMDDARSVLPDAGVKEPLPNSRKAVAH